MKKRAFFKSSPAFTLIEVLLAMTILTSCLFIIANLQTRALNKVLRERDHIERTFLIKHDAYLAFVSPPEDERKKVNRLEKPEMTLTTQTVDIKQKSALKDVKDYVKMLKTEAAWKKDRMLYEEEIVSFVFKKVKKEKK